jgi:hypothetical protein
MRIPAPTIQAILREDDFSRCSAAARPTEDNVARSALHEGSTNITTVLGKGEPSGTTWVLVHD